MLDSRLLSQDRRRNRSRRRNGRAQLRLTILFEPCLHPSCGYSAPMPQATNHGSPYRIRIRWRMSPDRPRPAVEPREFQNCGRAAKPPAGQNSIKRRTRGEYRFSCRSALCSLSKARRLDTVLMNRLDGDAVGPVKVLVSNPVYSHDRQHVLVPEGTIVLGEARKIGSVRLRAATSDGGGLPPPDHAGRLLGRS